ncbi:protein FAM210B, mitochondrial isoform X2 [Rhipicephalus sanguineus]|uniref:protein FAM210B, mitochondrial isoform X2 n=2 Tax=Rhipicephalus sanguineus TaxID=34632 RepID=UPI0018962BFB|nr:protein FAM210B, mitochondrial isoform X2 [Rhipicephalus sanguineus]
MRELRKASSRQFPASPLDAVSILAPSMGSHTESSSVSQGDAGNTPPPVSRKEKWKHAIKEYGSAMVAFHVVLSVTSFGICYLLVSSGVDMTTVAEKLGFSMDSQWVNSKVAGGSGTLVLAYAVHKLFTPVRMGITLSTTPMLVRWLRRNGVWGFRY